jgi:hypothetical protein
VADEPAEVRIEVVAGKEGPVRSRRRDIDEGDDDPVA